MAAKENVPAEPAKDVAVMFKEPKGFKRAVLVNFPSCDVRPLEPKRRGRATCLRRGAGAVLGDAGGGGGLPDAGGSV